MKHARSIAGILILIAAVLGTIDSFYLVLQYIAAIQTGGEATPCSPSTLVNCTKTVQGPWAHFFGPPNPMFGMLWYSGAILYGAAVMLGTRFSKNARLFIGVFLVLGAVFSYTLYLASVIALRGVCPFCLLSTTLSTVILLSFFVDDASGSDPVLKKPWHLLLYAYQAFSVAVFVIGLPVFLIVYIPLLLEPMEAMTHWSFPVMVVLIVVMAITHAWAFIRLRVSLR